MLKPLDKSSVREVDTCDCLGKSTARAEVRRLCLDPHKFDEPPLIGDCVAKNPHWKLLKSALEAAAHVPGSPIMCSGGGSDKRVFTCELRNRACKAKLLSKKDGAPREDDCINTDKGGRRAGGMSEVKRTRTT